MKQMTDEEFDKLLGRSFKRMAIGDQVEEQVMGELKHSALKSWLRRWGKIVLLSFALPLFAASFVYGLVWLVRNYTLPIYVSIGMGACAVLLSYLLWQFIRKFSVIDLS